MILGIEASNIRTGGGLTHLTEILSNIESAEMPFEKVIVWASTSTLAVLPNKEWLVKVSNKMIDKSFVTAMIWQTLFFRTEARNYGCNMVFAPGSTFLSPFRPFVSMSQNMLPFERAEMLRFKKKSDALKFRMLNITQSLTFKRAKGLIFLTNYAKQYISGAIHLDVSKSIIIPHGISANFLNKPKVQADINTYSVENPYRLLYVSIITVYKHQWNVVKAVSALREKGYPVVLDLVGPKTEEGFALLEPVLQSVPSGEQYVFYHGSADRNQLRNFYLEADAFVFASSCENMPIILIEAMTSGLPIACSDRGPMPEVLKDNGFYFDPENVDSIENAIEKMLRDTTSRDTKSNKSYEAVKSYTWKNCAVKTFDYLYQVAQNQ